LTNRTANPLVGDEEEKTKSIDEDKENERENLSLEFNRLP
jgi:hypothetical protein